MSNKAHIINIGVSPIGSTGGGGTVIDGSGFDWYSSLNTVRALTNYYDGMNAGCFANTSIYRFNATSTLPDDGADVLKPDNISTGAGRFLRQVNLAASQDFLAALEETLVVKGVTVGNLSDGNTFVAGTTIETLLRQMLIKAIAPTFTNPTAALAIRDYASANIISKVEVGTVIDIRMDASFVQNDAGALIAYEYLVNAVQQAYQAGNQYRYVPGSVIGNEIIQFMLRAHHEAGADKLDNLGNTVSSPISAGYVQATKNLEGVFRAFFGTGEVLNSAQVRGLAGNLLDVKAGSQFTITIPQGQTIVTFAYPSSLGNPSKVIYVEGFNTDLVAQGIFTSPSKTIQVQDASGSTNYEYSVFQQYLPATYDTDVNYIITV